MNFSIIRLNNKNELRLFYSKNNSDYSNIIIDENIFKSYEKKFIFNQKIYNFFSYKFFKSNIYFFYWKRRFKFMFILKLLSNNIEFKILKRIYKKRNLLKRFFFKHLDYTKERYTCLIFNKLNFSFNFIFRKQFQKFSYITKKSLNLFLANSNKLLLNNFNNNSRGIFFKFVLYKYLVFKFVSFLKLNFLKFNFKNSLKNLTLITNNDSSSFILKSLSLLFFKTNQVFDLQKGCINFYRDLSYKNIVYTKFFNIMRGIKNFKFVYDFSKTFTFKLNTKKFFSLFKKKKRKKKKKFKFQFLNFFFRLKTISSILYSNQINLNNNYYLNKTFSKYLIVYFFIFLINSVKYLNNFFYNYRNENHTNEYLHNNYKKDIYNLKLKAFRKSIKPKIFSLALKGFFFLNKNRLKKNNLLQQGSTFSLFFKLLIHKQNPKVVVVKNKRTFIFFVVKKFIISFNLYNNNLFNSLDLFFNLKFFSFKIFKKIKMFLSEKLFTLKHFKNNQIKFYYYDYFISKNLNFLLLNLNKNFLNYRIFYFYKNKKSNSLINLKLLEVLKNKNSFFKFFLGKFFLKNFLFKFEKFAVKKFDYYYLSLLKKFLNLNKKIFIINYNFNIFSIRISDFKIFKNNTIFKNLILNCFLKYQLSLKSLLSNSFFDKFKRINRNLFFFNFGNNYLNTFGKLIEFKFFANLNKFDSLNKNLINIFYQLNYLIFFNNTNNISKTDKSYLSPVSFIYGVESSFNRYYNNLKLLYLKFLSLQIFETKSFLFLTNFCNYKKFIFYNYFMINNNKLRFSLFNLLKKINFNKFDFLHNSLNFINNFIFFSYNFFFRFFYGILKKNIYLFKYNSFKIFNLIISKFYSFPIFKNKVNFYNLFSKINFLSTFFLINKNFLRKINIVFLFLKITKRNFFVNLVEGWNMSNIFSMSGGETKYEGRLKKTKEAGFVVGRRLWNKMNNIFLKKSLKLLYFSKFFSRRVNSLFSYFKLNFYYFKNKTINFNNFFFNIFLKNFRITQLRLKNTISYLKFININFFLNFNSFFRFKFYYNFTNYKINFLKFFFFRKKQRTLKKFLIRKKKFKLRFKKFKFIFFNLSNFFFKRFFTLKNFKKVKFNFSNLKKVVYFSTKNGYYSKYYKIYRRVKKFQRYFMNPLRFIIKSLKKRTTRKRLSRYKRKLLKVFKVKRKFNLGHFYFIVPKKGKRIIRGVINGIYDMQYKTFIKAKLKPKFIYLRKFEFTFKTKRAVKRK